MMTARGQASAERQMVVVTPTYAPDLELFSDLHESVLQCFPADVRHVVVVTERNVVPFRRFEGPRCIVVGIDDVLPRSVRALPRVQTRINLRQPVPPLRGWILQQLVKLAVAERAPERIVIMADSDLVFVRPVTVETFAPGGRVRLYRKDNAVDGSMSRHVRWHAVARKLLELPAVSPPLPDYVSGLNSWDGRVVRRMFRHIENASGRGWIEAIGKELHFSEQILYGVHADVVERANDLTPTQDSLCHEYYNNNFPLTAERARGWLASVGPDDVAYMISSKSQTPLHVRRAAHASVFAS